MDSSVSTAQIDSSQSQTSPASTMTLIDGGHGSERQFQPQIDYKKGRQIQIQKRPNKIQREKQREFKFESWRPSSCLLLSKSNLMDVDFSGLKMQILRGINCCFKHPNSADFNLEKCSVSSSNSAMF
uniref:Uncharacterized protein n=1 Tax=Solanum lycopersicum TaxID=4081 RepID=A0A3Q7HPN1_SOLLC